MIVFFQARQLANNLRLSHLFRFRAMRSLFDEGSNHLRLRHINGVAAFDLDTVEPARLDIDHRASGGIILSSVVSKYQLGFGQGLPGSPASCW